MQSVCTKTASLTKKNVVHNKLGMCFWVLVDGITKQLGFSVSTDVDRFGFSLQGFPLNENQIRHQQSKKTPSPPEYSSTPPESHLCRHFGSCVTRSLPGVFSRSHGSRCFFKLKTNKTEEEEEEDRQAVDPTIMLIPEKVYAVMYRANMDVKTMVPLVWKTLNSHP